MSAPPQNRLLFARILSDYQLGPGQVIRAMTSMERARDQRALENSRIYFRKHLPAIVEDVIENFLALKQTAAPVGEVYGETAELIYLAEPEMRTIFSIGRNRTGGKDGWKEFRGLYPKSKGVIDVSQPAYSADGTQCLVEVGQQLDWLAGCGSAHLYTLADGSWKSAAQIGTWIS